MQAIEQELPELGDHPRILTFNYDTGERYLSVPDFLPEEALRRLTLPFISAVNRRLLTSRLPGARGVPRSRPNTEESMRRSRFAEIDAQQHDREAAFGPRSPVVRPARPEASDDESLAESRIANLDHLALLIGFTHLL